jgi:phosphoribosylformimino-5-aminoimidazole carboxamide ribotide isomerase
MRIIPVIDLLGGQVVRGIGGRRELYRPVVSRIAPDARPASVAAALVEQFGLDTVYVADLQAIMDEQPDPAAWREIAATGMRLWLDAGVGNRQTARRVIDLLGPITPDFVLVVGLETLQSLDELREITRQWDVPVVSLDLRAGVPLTPIATWANPTPLGIAAELEQYGTHDLIVLDLADVGMGAGTSTLELCRQLRTRSPRQRLIAGGGIRGLDDVRALADAGCEAALVASALHDGRLTREDIERARQLGRRQTEDGLLR